MSVSDTLSTSGRRSGCHYSFFYNRHGHSTYLSRTGRYLTPWHETQGSRRRPAPWESWMQHLSSDDYSQSSMHGEDVHIHGWELFGQRAIRRGRWKAVWISKPKGKGDWELYDMVEDLAEVCDLPETWSEMLRQLVEHWEKYYAETGMVQTPMFD